MKDSKKTYIVPITIGENISPVTIICQSAGGSAPVIGIGTGTKGDFIGD